MRERQLSRRNEEPRGEIEAAPPERSSLEEVRNQAQGFLQAADEALERLESLRQSPEEILAAITQEGGQ